MNLARHGWKELIHLTPRPKRLAACAAHWMAGWLLELTHVHTAVRAAVLLYMVGGWGAVRAAAVVLLLPLLYCCAW